VLDVALCCASIAIEQLQFGQAQQIAREVHLLKL